MCVLDPKSWIFDLRSVTSSVSLLLSSSPLGFASFKSYRETAFGCELIDSLLLNIIHLEVFTIFRGKRVAIFLIFLLISRWCLLIVLFEMIFDLGRMQSVS